MTDSENAMSKSARADIAQSGLDRMSEFARSRAKHPCFRTLWYSCNFLLIISFVFLLYSLAWEYSTRRYLKGFSDAIVPEESAPDERIEAIINWMSKGPARQQELFPGHTPDRDPTDTLNYASLLQVCGTATNAFVNLADSAGVPARRLLLLNSQRTVKHVVAEAWINGRWIVVDPAFRTILHGPNGELLTREELANPMVFAAATKSIQGYDPIYTFERTAHVRLSRLGGVGPFLRRNLALLAPGWEDSSLFSLLLERRSLEALLTALVFVTFFSIVRLGLRRYGEKRLGITVIRIRHQVRRAFVAFLDTAG